MSLAFSEEVDSTSRLAAEAVPASLPHSLSPAVPLAWHGASFDAELARPELLHRLFEAQADARPAEVALACGDDRATYAEVDRAANQLARYLNSRGIGPGKFVGIWLPRSMDVYVAMLGVLKSGAAYAPLDAEYPTDRVTNILQDCGASLLLTVEPLRAKLASTAASSTATPCPTVALDVSRREVFTSLDSRLTEGETGVTPESIAYVIYTSGSTGRPKGVPIRHASVCNFVRAEAKLFCIRPEDRVWQGFSVAFDASVEEIWLAFNCGAALVFAAGDAPVAGPASARRLTEERITVLSCVPTLLAMFDEDLPTVRLLIVGGEACTPALVERWAIAPRRMVNTYGPTEATVVATYAEVYASQPVTIGRPLANYCTYIVDEELREALPGESGELVLGGVGLSPGYVGRPEETARRFVANPFADTVAWSPRLYRTGDLARFTVDGEIEFLGRADDQVKLRGFRVELSEIERVALELGDVRQAAVTVREDVPGLPRLVCYVVPREPASFDVAQCRAAMASRLPVYMVPAIIQTLERMPTTTSGKIDRRSLPAPTVTEVSTTADYGNYTTAERRIAECWGRLIGVTHIGLDDNFFQQLGGHSLMAARAVSELRADASFAHLSVVEIYNHPTVRELALLVDEQAMSVTEPVASLSDAADHAVDPADSPRRRAWRHFGCGLLQTGALYFVIGLFSLQWLAPYLTYTWFYDNGYGVPEALLAAFGSVVCVYPVMLCVGIAAKWLVLGRIRAGRHRLWGFYYFRWWFVRTILSIVPIGYLTGTPLMSLFLRALGAKVGRNTLIDSDALSAFDLISIGDDTCLGNDSALIDSTVEDDYLIIAPITIGDRCFVGTRTVLTRDCAMEDDSALEDLSMLSPGTTIPAGSRWRGSPAAPLAASPNCSVDTTPIARPSQMRRIAFGLLAACSIFLFPMVMLAALFPGVVVMNELNYRDDYYSYLVVSPLTALSYVVLLTLLIAGVKWLVLGRAKAGSYPLYGHVYFRKWFVDQLLSLSLDVLGTLYATVYLNPWYRLLGAKLGKDAEVSTASFISPDLLEIGDEGFIADSVSLGSARYEHGTMTIDHVRLGRRAFIGNSALVPPGSVIGDDCLIGSLSTPPTTGKTTEPETSWLGSPPVFLPRRQHSAAFAEETTFRPSLRLRLLRAFIEFFRVILPMTGFICATSVLLSLVVVLREHVSETTLVLLWPLLYVTAGLGVVGFVVALKWLLVGRYHPEERPLWSRFVWLTELVTGLHEQLACLFLVDKLVGTPYVGWYFRLLGAKIGKRVYLNSTDITEFDLVSLGDDAAINQYCTLQSHLFEDRVMKTGSVDVGAGCSVGAMSLVLYDTRMEPGAKLGDLSLLMKGESLRADTDWLGIPARRVSSIAARHSLPDSRSRASREEAMPMADIGER